MRILLFISFALSTMTAYAQENVACAYDDAKTHELEQSDRCGLLESNGLLRLDKELLRKVRWSKYGMQCIHVSAGKNSGWYFINQNGQGRATPFYQDNDCNPFKEGVAVGLSEGNVVYFDQTLSIVKETEYTWASGFHSGYSKVCKGALVKEYDSQGEHYWLKGGQCGFVNRQFEVIIPLQHRYEDTPEPESSSQAR